jgi:hypothetical protein
MPSCETISDGPQYFRAGVDVNRFQYTGNSAASIASTFRMIGVQLREICNRLCCKYGVR